ncbi:MAG: MTH1187 family thiamine-binding protein [Candidatus Nitronauta litoralis]|uniref:MTH1187 family thiamine-binding protein n=1 Tax=Candidatus Nitronauta litoralis TaxID=2705533 RepID=A0A7T0FZK0_9BACT|nr:MAG: MTH1187 family thiamine-binding protein [Candidatus Nitronauta litoralis]
MVLLQFSMSPMDKGESVSDYVSRSLDIISNSGVSYKLGPMGTCLEGEWDEVMGVIKQCYEKMSSDCNRITCSIKIDYRKGKSGRLDSKMAAVEMKLGKKLNT